MDRKSFKILAFVLSILVTITSLPITAFAYALQTNNDVLETESSVADNAIFEVVEMRSATTKHFRLEDGSFYVAQYNTDIHYEDENGKWQDIDNTLAVSGSEISTNNAKIKFAKKTTGNSNLFTLHDKNRKLSLSLNNANKKVEGKITNNNTEFSEDATQLHKMTTLDKISASVTYEDILQGTDLEYVINGLNIKENIIVKEKTDNYSYSFTMSLNNLIATKNSVGEIIISDSTTNDTVYIIPAPVMWDSAGNTSNDIITTLVDEGNGKYSLTVTASSEWMNSDERVYPIIIDPPINSVSSTSNTVDLYLDSQNPDNVASSSSTSLFISSRYKSYWKLLELPEIPSSAYLTNATFELTGYFGGFPQGYIGVYDVLTDWDTTLSWNDVISSPYRGERDSNFIDYQQVYFQSGTASDATYDLSWNVTPLVKKWYSGENYGLMLDAVEGTTFPYVATFYSSNYSVASKRPLLTIEYRDMKGLEDYWAFTTHSVGYAGSGSVNIANGNLVFNIPTLTSTDSIMPITPSFVYNSALASVDYSYPNVETAYSTPFTARGVKLNISETLIKKAFIDETASTSYFFVWSDGDGTEHYFMPTDTSNTYVDEDGLLLTLVENSGTCTITDDNDYVRTFLPITTTEGIVSAWYLSSIADKVGNKVTFSVDSSNRPVVINLVPATSTSPIKQLELAYNSKGAVYAIWNPNSGEGVVIHYSGTTYGSISTSRGNYIRQVIRAHGGTTEENWEEFYNTKDTVDTATITVDAVAEYEYDDNGAMISATMLSTQYQMLYTYDEEGRIIAAKEHSLSEASDGQEFEIEYETSSSVVLTGGADGYMGGMDEYTTYCFDSWGRPVSCYSSEEVPNHAPQFLGASSYQYVDDESEKVKNNVKTSTTRTQHSSNYLYNGGFEANTTSTSTIPYWTTSGNASIGYSLAFDGEAAAKLTVNGNDDSSSIKQHVILYEGDYSLSMYINTNGIYNDNNGASDIQITLSANCTGDSSKTVTKNIRTDELYADGSYGFIGLDFSVESTTSGYEWYDIIVEITGDSENDATVYVDNVMLSKTIGPVEYDMVQNGNFRGGDISDFWSIYEDDTLTPQYEVLNLDGPFGYVLSIDGAFNDPQSVSQVVYKASSIKKTSYLNGTYSETEPVRYTVSGWGKGTGQSYSGDSNFAIKVYVDYYNAPSASSRQTETFNFDKGITDWQFVSGSFATDPELGMVDTITVLVVYENHGGDGYFDDISLVKESSTTESCEYNSAGDMVLYESGYNKIWYEYENDNLVKAISSSKTIVDYEYDNLDRVIKETYTKYKGVYGSSVEIDSLIKTPINKVEYTYSPYGQVASITTTDLETSLKTTSLVTYNYVLTSHIFGSVSSETDSLGNTTRYFYDENNGRLLATIHPEGNGVSYTYDGMGNLTNVLPATITTDETGYVANTSGTSVNYAYDDTTKLLETITTKPSADTSTTYSFTYDGFGNTTEIKVGSRSLASYRLKSENGKLDRVTYGNGFAVSYDYKDGTGYVSTVEHRNPVTGYFKIAFEYEYDADGNLIQVNDHLNELITVYDYDSEGKLMDSFVYDWEAYQTLDDIYYLYGTTVFYDAQSRVESVYYSFNYTLPSETIHTKMHYSYSYDEDTGNLDGMIIENRDVSGSYIHFGSISPTYDNLGRTSSKVIDFTAHSFYNGLTYDYVTFNGNESGLVSQVTSVIKESADSSYISSTTYNYTYDANGNITQIADGSGVIQNKYYYDDLSQLVREDNRATGYTYTYTYDNAGNITAKKKYAFTTGALGSVQETINYTYGDSEWKDLLTNYNGTAITYDDIGNPLTIGNKALSWWGRDLSSWTDGNTTITFGYNNDGIRTYKEISDGTDTERHEYYVNGSQIIGEIVYLNGTEQHTLVYIYDELGMPIGLKYRTPAYEEDVYDCYFFEKNLQGDIVAIYNEYGVKIGTYTYDAWGNVTATALSTSSLDSLILTSYNPFRYRGYYYDVETSLYYLQSRYYNPDWGRFVNADGQLNQQDYILGFNMFAYCINNPVNGSDPCGTCFHRWMFWKDCAKCAEKKALEAAQTIKYDVPLYRQGTLSLCWAFCQTMVESYNSGTKLTQKEAKKRAIAIAKDYHSSTQKNVWNQGGWPSNVGECVGNIGSIEELYNTIQNNGPVYAYYSNENSAHLVVVTGVNLYRGVVYTNNPWGVSGVQSFEKFQNGYATKWYHFSNGISTSGAIIYLIN